jgi:hypothetical protein
MPRTESYLLRLSKQEKDQLAEKARTEGVSIAKLIRQRVGLDVKEPDPERMEKVLGAIKPADETPAQRVSQLADRVNELARRMPRSNAERVARKELA